MARRHCLVDSAVQRDVSPMRLALDEEETQIADQARKILTDTVPIARLHHGEAAGLSSKARHTIAEMGWFGLMLSEHAGGAGMSEIEFALFFREVGRQCAPIELLCQSLAVVLAANKPEIIDSLLNGQHGVSLLLKDEADSRLLGAPGGFAIEVDPTSARLIDLGTQSGRPQSSLDPAVQMHTVPGREFTIVYQTSNPAIWRQGQLATAAMLVGITEAALAQIVEYARIRETFGKPIGSYQAVRHPCADIAVRLEAARCQLWFAAAAMKENRTDAVGHLDAAKHLANECAAFSTDLNIQLHGGIGVTDEHDAHILMKHALLLRKLFGSKRRLLNDLLHADFGA